jgi:hypothetical protein
MGIRSEGSGIDLNATGINPLTSQSTQKKTVYTKPLTTTYIGDVNITTAGSFNWLINMPESALAKSAKYAVWFQSESPADPANNPPLGSPFFIIVHGSPSTSSASTSTTLPTSTSSLTSTGTPPLPPKQSSGGLSTGAKGGIGAAAAVVGLAILGAVVFFLRRRKQRKSLVAPPEYDITDPPKMKQYSDNTGHPSGLLVVENPAELHNVSPAELYGGR